MKKRIIIATATALILGLTACSSNSAPENEIIVETAAGDITKEEFYQEMKSAQGEALLREMVVEKVLSEKYTVTDEEVEERINEMKEQYGEQFQMFLSQYGIKDEEQLADVLRSSMLQEKAATEDIEVTEEEMKEHYEGLQAEIKASHILLEDKETAEEALVKINEGEDFEEVAKEYSTGPSGPNGGDLGFFGPGDMVAEFEEAAYALEVGEVSQPVETEFGWHIIKVTDKKELEPYEDMKEEIRQEIIGEKFDPQMAQQAIQDIMDEANVKVHDDDLKDIFEAPEAPAAPEGTNQ
jgi:foldase protein PrsA